MTPTAARDQSTIARLLVRAGRMPFLARTGLHKPLRKVWHLASNLQQSVRSWQVELDYRSFRRKYGFLNHGVVGVAPGKKVLVVNLGSDTIGWLKTEALLAKALQLHGHTPIILTFHGARRDLEYFRLFGLSHFEFFDADQPPMGPAQVERAAEAMLEGCSTIKDVMALQFHGVDIGRHVLSTVSMHLRKGRLEFSDPEVHELLQTLLPGAVHAAVTAEALLDGVQPDAILLREKGYMRFGEVYDVALNRGIDTLSWNVSHQHNGLIFKRYSRETRHLHPFSLSPETWRAVRDMPWTEERARELSEELRRHYREDGRFKGEPLQAGKRVLPASEVRQRLGLDPHKKTAVIFSHILWDGSLSYGESLFDDYEEWLVETVKAASANPAVNWVVKFHPANLWKSKQVHHRGELWDRAAIRKHVGPLPDHVKLLDPETEINTWSLFEVTDYCVTVRGTIGIEMACFGVRVFTAGSGRYSGLGFTEDSRSREEYLSKLRSIHAFPALAREQVDLAKRHAHVLFLLRPWRMRTFDVIYLPVQKADHPLNPLVVIRARSMQDLLQAPDLAAFAEWATNSTQPDFVKLRPDLL